ncbi:MAG: hypothetical protein KDA59_03470, partial [Planctomycetales bacterium]|nr:hypothetical protein [Planctomycetales bacterium]
MSWSQPGEKLAAGRQLADFDAITRIRFLPRARGTTLLHASGRIASRFVRPIPVHFQGARRCDITLPHPSREFTPASAASEAAW